MGTQLQPQVGIPENAAASTCDQPHDGAVERRRVPEKKAALSGKVNPSGAKSLTKTDVNFWLDALLLVVFTALCWASTVVRFVFPPGTQASGWSVWGWDFDAWNALEYGLLCAFAAAVLIHVMLHWNWVCGVVASKLRKRRGPATAGKRDEGSWTLWGVGLLIVVFHVIAAGVAAAALCVQPPG